MKILTQGIKKYWKSLALGYAGLLILGTLVIRGRSVLEWVHVLIPPGPLQEKAIYVLQHHHPVTFAFLLQFSDTLINVALFLPVGWMIYHLLHSRPSLSIHVILFVSLGVSCVFSLSIELLQAYVPQRIPSLSDVVANTGGAVVGCYLPYFWKQIRRKREV